MLEASSVVLLCLALFAKVYGHSKLCIQCYELVVSTVLTMESEDNN